MLDSAIIGLTGPAGSGKDTVADYLVCEHGFTKLAFASGLKDMLEVIGIYEPSRDKKELTLPGLNFSYRHAAQTLGTEWGRKLLQDDLWVSILQRRIYSLQWSGVKRFVISDVRFENEATMLRSVPNSVIVHVVGRAATLDGAAKAHASERGVEPRGPDYSLDNTRGLQELYANVDKLLERRFNETSS